MLFRAHSSCLALVAGVALFLAPARASAQLYDDVWFKVRASVTGVSVDGSGELAKASAGVVAYLHFTTTVVAPTDASGPPISYYQVDVVTEVSPGSFAITDSTLTGLIGPDEKLAVALNLRFHLGDGSDDPYFTGALVVAFHPRLDDQGQLRKARVKSVAGITQDATLDGVTGFVGAMKLAGVSVDPAKLPFPADL